MLFNSIEFLLFLPSVFILYWFIFPKNYNYQNILIVIASYIFYGWWDWRFLLLIFASTILDYSIGLKLYKTTSKQYRKILLYTSIIINLGMLCFFKYYNFFIDSLASSFQFFNINPSFTTLNIILPVGISFYTFQTLSYNLDIYKKKLTPTTNFMAFTAFVSFFPQLVAGPIERATHLLPQFHKKRVFNFTEAKTGIQLMIWGFFKKIVIADNAAIIVNGIFENHTNQSSISLCVGAILFAFQIYCDFSAYSDIAIGLARLFNFDLMLNFKFPYLATNISEFWKRWHISLSTWFKDYIYIPLGGSKKGKIIAFRNILIVFVISGFWHGANWTFIFWGTLHGLLYIPVFLIRKKSTNESLFLRLLKTITTFLLVTLGWIFFRANNIHHALEYFSGILHNHGKSYFFLSTNKYMIITMVSFISILLMLFIEAYFDKKGKNEVLLKKHSLLLLIIITIFLGAFKNHSNFIYFQF